MYLVLHPRHKTTYFKHAKWKAAWIQEVIDMLRERFDLCYRKQPGPTVATKTQKRKVS
jgi:hypothetical protein